MNNISGYLQITMDRLRKATPMARELEKEKERAEQIAGQIAEQDQEKK